LGRGIFFLWLIGTASSIYIAAGSCTLVPICSLPQPAAANHGGLRSNLLPARRRTSQEAAESHSRLPGTAAHPALRSHHHKAGKAGSSSRQAGRQQQQETAAEPAAGHHREKEKTAGLSAARERKAREDECTRERLLIFLRTMHA
jgi:hypothetical protein